MRDFLYAILMLSCISCPAISQAADEMKMDARLPITLNPDAMFSGAAELNGKIVWTHSGTWVLQEGAPVWAHDEASRPLPESPRMEVDEIISLDADHLVLLSQPSGVHHSFARVRQAQLAAMYGGNLYRIRIEDRKSVV